MKPFNYMMKCVMILIGIVISVSCSGEFERPPVILPDLAFTGDGTNENPYTVRDVIKGAAGSRVWVTGFIVGSVLETTYDSAMFGSSPAAQTNLLLAYTPDESDPARCIPVQLLYGDVRDMFNLAGNPGRYKTRVNVQGNLEKYFGVQGVKAVVAAVSDENQISPDDKDQGDDGDGNKTPDGTVMLFTPVKSIVSGGRYLIVSDGKYARPITGSYGYLQVSDVVVDGDGVIDAGVEHTFTFEAADDDSFYIRQHDGRYLYTTREYDRFSLSDVPEDGAGWHVTFESDKAIITDVITGKAIQLDYRYDTYGAYSDIRGTYPVLYELSPIAESKL